MNVIVAGPRTFTDYKLLEGTLDHYTSKLDKKKLTIIHGGAPGADRLTSDWCFKRMVKCKIFHPDWEKHKKATGPIRNSEMLREGAQALIAFQPKKGTTPGTQDMIKQARKAGIKVKVIEY